MRSRIVGLFLVRPLVVRLRFDHLIAQAGSPGSQMVPAVNAMLSRLALKRRDQERRSHFDDFTWDEAVGLFAGRNIPPQKSFTTDSSSRTQRPHQQRLRSAWIARLSALLVPHARAFSGDCHALPSRGDPTGLDTPSIATRGKAGPRVLTCFAPEQERRVLGSGNAHWTRDDQAGAVLRFVAFWPTRTGHDPHWLDCDSPAVPQPALSRINRRGLGLGTIRRRGVWRWRRRAARPAHAWHRAVIALPKRRPQNIRFVDETVERPGQEGSIRQRAVTGLGRDQPPLFWSNKRAESARNWIKRQAGRNRGEDGLGLRVNFFPRDCLASEVRRNGARDVARTVLAQGCYRWLAACLKGVEKAAPKQLDRTFVETGGGVEIQATRILVRRDRRCHNPILRAATTSPESEPVPWLNNLPVTFEYS